MNSLAKSDIFFLITSLVVVCLGVGLVIAIVYLIRILNDIKKISQAVKDESVNVVQDISQLRTSIKARSLVGALVALKRFFFRNKKGRKN